MCHFRKIVRCKTYSRLNRTVGIYVACLAACWLLISCSGDSTTAPEATSGAFTLLTYNVAGLPQGASASNPQANMALISPLLNKYDIALVQEDFVFHNELASQIRHKHKSTPKAPASQLRSSDGLNRFSVFPFSRFERKAWQTCSNASGADCLASKGFSVAETELAKDVKIAIYNVHFDAGGQQEDIEARRLQIQQLLDDLNSRAAGRAVIVAGDFNLDVANRSQDVPLFQTLLQDAGLTDACQATSCDTELVDRVLFRASSTIDLTVTQWQTDPDFVDGQGQKLSDHFAVGVSFAWAIE